MESKITSLIFRSILLSFQSIQPLPRILGLSNTRVHVLPEVEKFLVVFHGIGFFPDLNLKVIYTVKMTCIFQN